jgi:hypothetical protein
MQAGSGQQLAGRLKPIHASPPCFEACLNWINPASDDYEESCSRAFFEVAA